MAIFRVYYSIGDEDLTKEVSANDPEQARRAVDREIKSTFPEGTAYIIRKTKVAKTYGGR